MELPWKLVAVVGVPGVGKTSLCREVSNNLECKYLNYGDLMLEIAQSWSLAWTDEEMFSLDMDLQQEIWKTTALKIKNMENIIVDLHGVDQSKEGYILSLPMEILRPDFIIIIESSEENILEQRNKDNSKKRIVDNIKSLKMHMEILRISMAVNSAILGCNFLILRNDDFDQCLAEIIGALGGVSIT